MMRIGSLILCCLIHLAGNLYSQDTRLSLDLQQVTVDQVLSKIENLSEFYFLYNNKLIEVNRKVDIYAENQPIKDILEILFAGTDVDFVFIGNQIVLSPGDDIREAKQRLQTRIITGTVTDEKGEPLFCATVNAVGTVSATITDIRGNYAIHVPADIQTLAFSYVGMVSQEVDIAGQTQINITMEADVIGLEEVIVLGYGTSNKRDMIGSITKIKGRELNSPSIPSIDGILQGTASGLLVTSSTGNPGAVPRVLIRGQHSISSASEPVWVLDGIILGSNLDFPLIAINPNDIESMEVLKDAAATAIYGQRGSNGVIIITTKSGRPGIRETNIDYSQGISSLIKHPDDYGFADTQEWFDVIETARANSGLVPVEYDPVVHGAVNKFDPSATLTRSQALATQVNWFDQILRTGSFREVNLSTSGGSDNITYFGSVNYYDDQGVIKNEYLKRFSIRSNVGYHLTDNLSIETRLTGVYYYSHYAPNLSYPGRDNTNTAQGGFAYALEIEPWNPIYKPEDQSKLWNTLSGKNLLATNDPDNIRNDHFNYRVLASTAFVYRIPLIKGFSLRGEAAIDYQQNQFIFWSNTIVRRESAYARDSRNVYRHLSDNLYGIFDRTFGDHGISLVSGIESEKAINTSTFIEGDHLAGTAQQIGTPGNPLRIYGLFNGEVYLRGYFGRMNYKLKDKYLAGFSFRRDGTSEFTSDYRWGTFSSLYAGWIISDEDFMQDFGFVNFLKIRGSFGQTGNAIVPGGINSPGYKDWMRYGPKAWNIPKGTAVSNLPVEDVSWETTNGRDAGIDFSLFNNRIGGSIAYYNQLVENMLLAVPIPISSGLFTLGSEPYIWNNIGDMRNSGIEISLNTYNLNMNDFKWSTSMNLTTNRAEIVSLNHVLDEKGNGISSGNTLSRTGGVLGSWYLTEFAGIDPDYGYPLIYQADNNIYLLDESGNPTTKRNPNYLHRYVDPETGEYLIVPATNVNTNTNRILHEGKSGIPTWFGGMNNTFRYKGLDLTIVFIYAGGHYIYDNVSAALYTPAGNFISGLKDLTWTETNRDALLPELSATNRYDEYDQNGNLVTANQNFASSYPSDQWLVKGDYLKLKTFRLGYDFRKSMVEKLKLKGLGIYIAAENLWTWTAEFEGYDPEGARTGGSAQVRNLQQGDMQANLPSLKTFYFGANFRF